jgi:predicted metalloprotease with PDZ domain
MTPHKEYVNGITENRRASVKRDTIGAAGFIVLLACLAVTTLAIHREVSSGLLPRRGDQSAPAIGMLVNRDLTVVAVDAMGSAARAGIRPGDTLLQIGRVALPHEVAISPRRNGLPTRVPGTVKNSNDVKAVFLAAVPRWEKYLTVAVKRHGHRIALHALITGRAYEDGSANPQASVTPVPASMDERAFYI